MGFLLSSCFIVLALTVTVTISFSDGTLRQQNKKPPPYCEKGGSDCNFLTNGEGIFGVCEGITVKQKTKYICVEAFVQDMKDGFDYDAKREVPKNADGKKSCEERGTISKPAKEVCLAALTKNNGKYKILNREYKVETTELDDAYLCKGENGKELIVCPVRAIKT